jgi:putative alpha-1,2-mannosidase
MTVAFPALQVAAVVLFPAAAAAQARTEAPALLVDPFVGTLGDFGQLSPAASAPFGMVHLGPDTSPANHAGYDHAATMLAGFSHTRMEGVGCSGAGGDVRISLTYAGAPALSAMDKGSERAEAGYYRLRYGPGIVAEMTATRGAGAIRFTLPRPGKVIVTVDYSRTYSRHLGAKWHGRPDGDLWASFSAGTVCDAGAYHLHAATRLVVAGKRLPVRWRGDRAVAATTALPVRAGEVIELRTGLSSVDPAAAARVRDIELGAARFASLLRRTRAEWNRELSRITISGPPEQRAMFATAMYRVLQTPVLVSDPDGRFRGSDGRLVQLRRGDAHYSGWAMWDNYRTRMPLLALLDPPRAAAVARSLVRLYGSGKQRWATMHEPFPTVRTEHSGITLLDFRRKGIAGFDARAALAGMAAESPHLARRTPDEQLEAAYDDWAVAELAQDLGDTALAGRHRALALSYRPMWVDVFADPGADADIVRARGLYQGTLAQYRWAPVFDLAWLRQTMGDRFRPELRRFFAGNLFNMTNQPDIHVPYLLAWDGAPAETAAVVERYLTQEVEHRYTNAAVRPRPWVGRSFALSPQGFADGMDDDAGTMTAWYVWATLGLYPLVPGEPEYVVTRPQAEIIVIRPAGGRRIILGKSAGGGLLLDGAEVHGTHLSHARLLGRDPGKAAAGAVNGLAGVSGHQDDHSGSSRLPSP